MYAIFQKKGQQGHKHVKKGQKRAKYLKIWTKVCKIWKYFEKVSWLSHAVNCENRPWMMVWPAWEISMDQKQNKCKSSSFQFLKLNLILALQVKRIWRSWTFQMLTLNLNTGSHKPYNKPNNNPFISISIQIIHRI